MENLTTTISFQVDSKPSKDLLEALNESEQILEDIRIGKRKGYNNIQDLINFLDED